ncbi:MAG: hypothetical protein DDT32_01687 [Syntrophomonadaceae bacterium]|nr:hypothetical protein [Bacillota bacterium]MBT9147919.1 hypothetical protein [Bacillota bacterium]
MGRRKKKRVFVSFDYENDKELKDLLVGQSRLSYFPFEIIDWSMKEAAPQRNWEREAKGRIKRSRKVVVVAGRRTHKAPGVIKEVEMARELGVPVMQIIGLKRGKCPRVPNAGRRYKWTWENLGK